MPKKSSIDWQFGIKIHSSFSGSRFKISGKGGSPAPSPLNKCETFQVMILLIDCLLPAITISHSQVATWFFSLLLVRKLSICRMISVSTTCEIRAGFFIYSASICMFVCCRADNLCNVYACVIIWQAHSTLFISSVGCLWQRQPVRSCCYVTAVLCGLPQHCFFHL